MASVGRAFLQGVLMPHHVMAANRVDAGRVQDLRRTKLVGTLGPAPGSPESLLDSFSK